METKPLSEFALFDKFVKYFNLTDEEIDELKHRPRNDRIFRSSFELYEKEKNYGNPKAILAWVLAGIVEGAKNIVRKQYLGFYSQVVLKVAGTPLNYSEVIASIDVESPDDDTGAIVCAG